MNKLPPQNIEAEESILSLLIIYPEHLPEFIDVLVPEDFYKTAHQTIYKTIIELYNNKINVDLSTVTTTLINNDQLKDIGGIDFINYIVEKCPIAIDREYHAKAVKEKSVLRDLISKANNIINNCYDTSMETTEVIDYAQNNVNSVILSSKSDNFMSMQDLTYESVDRYEDIKNKKPQGIKTGYPTIDRVVSITGGKLIIIAARPSMGKTSFMCCLIRNMAKKGIKTAIVSLEEERADIDNKFMSMESGINTMALNTKLSVTDFIKITEVADEKQDWPVLIDDTSPLHVVDLKRKCRLAKKAGAKAIFIDQLSKIRGRNRDDRFGEATECVQECAHVAKELKMPIFLLSQIKRIPRDDKKPRLSDLKNTGQLEEDASVVFLLYRKHPYTKAVEDLNHAEVEIAKNRGGTIWNIDMSWHSKTTEFKELYYETKNTSTAN